MAVLWEGLAVRRRGVYAEVQRPQAAPCRAHDVVVILARGRAMPPETRQREGSRRLATQLQAEGLPVGRYKARRVRPAAGSAVPHRKRCPVTTDRRHGDAVAPKLVARPGDGAQSATIGAGATTDLGTAEGW
jgi:putative transposase